MDRTSNLYIGYYLFMNRVLPTFFLLTVIVSLRRVGFLKELNILFIREIVGRGIMANNSMRMIDLFAGAGGVSATPGITCVNCHEILTKKAAIKSSAQ